MNKPIDETIIINIIKPFTTLAIPINQYEIADQYIRLYGKHITPRTVRKVIESLIEHGYPILSTPHEPGGYCWGGGDGEALECYRRLRRKAIKEMLRARWTLRNYRNRRGQLSLMEV